MVVLEAWKRRLFRYGICSLNHPASASLVGLMRGVRVLLTLGGGGGSD